jgi:AcrR family transcriptional regulator
MGEAVARSSVREVTVPAGGSRARNRRTQAERSAETRARVVRAATECVGELGYAGATTARIAERAGVTWGAMQHQFGDKEAIIDAVIDHTLEEFARQMGGLREAEPVLGRRVHAFTERAWAIFERPSYRAILSILLHRREKTERIAAVLTKQWVAIFGDLRLSPEQQFAAQRFTFVLLSGIATESLVVPGVEDSRSHFEVLERNLLRMLSSGGPPRQGSPRAGRQPSKRRPRGSAGKRGT